MGSLRNRLDYKLRPEGLNNRGFNRADMNLLCICDVTLIPGFAYLRDGWDNGCRDTISGGDLCR